MSLWSVWQDVLEQVRLSQLRVSLVIPSRGISSHFSAFPLWEKEALQKQVAALEAEKVLFEAKRNAAREYDILREKVEALEAEKVVLVAEKDEAVTTINNLLDSVVGVRQMDRVVASNMSLSKAHLQNARKIWLAYCRMWKLSEGHSKVYANDKAGSNILRAKMDKGSNPDFDYAPLFSEDEGDLVLSEKDET
ncbi:hypothetical protein ACOSQ4_017014 [Xanthoceras sorbifolium]